MQSKKYRVSERRRSSSVSEENNGKFNKTFKITMLVIFLLCLIIIIGSCTSWKANSYKSNSETNDTFRSEKYKEGVKEEEEYLNEEDNFDMYVTTTQKSDLISFTTHQSLKTSQLDTNRLTSTPKTNDLDTIKTSNTDITQTATSFNETSFTTDYNNYTSDESNDMGDNNTVTPHYEFMTAYANTYPDSTHNYSHDDQSTTILNVITTYDWLLIISNSTTYSSNEISYDYESTTTPTFVERTENNYVSTPEDDSSLTTENKSYETTSTININLLITENSDHSTTDSATSIDVSTIENDNYETTSSEYDVSITQDNYDYTTPFDTTYSTNNVKLITENNGYDEMTTENVDNEFKVTSTETNERLISDDVTEGIDRNKDNKVHICESGSCKRLASKMLSYMNHSVDPCEDLYEYACGGLEADPQIISQDLSKQVFDQIKRSLKMHVNNTWYQPFVKYLDSCIKYDEYLIDDEKLKEVKKIVENIGFFYTRETWPKNRNYSDILSQLIADTILNNNPLMFDIVPEVHETNSKTFILQIIPTIGNSRYFQDSIKQKFYAQSINDNVTQWLNEVESLFKKIKKFIIDQDIDINFQTLHQYFMSYPSSTSHINEIFEEKDYIILTIKELHSQASLIEWTSIIYKLTGIILEPDAQIQIYFHHQIFDALKKFEHSDESQQIQFYNALVGLYTTNLYKQMVFNRIHSYEQCLTISMKFLPSQSSSLYMSALSKIQLYYFEQFIDDIFMELKETLKLKFRKLQWASIEGQEYLLKKLADIKLSLPDTLIYNGSPEQLTDNFFTNTLVLMKKYRESMYSVLKSDPNDPKELWTYFASPFQTSPQTIHSLSVILIPFGAIDWFSFQYNQKFDYFIFASIGNLLAREIAHFFDTNGMKYWNRTRIGSPFASINDDWTKAAYHEFINCQRNILFHEPIEITVPLDNQRIQYQVPPSTLNERLADVVGIKLAQETLNRIHTSHVTKLLPWLPLNTHQLFFLAYTQTYCTKSRLEDFNIFSYEISTLPNRVRIFAVAVNNKNIGEAWNCPEGSLTLPISLCDVFPDLNYDRDIMENVQISIN
ncbi:endothelin-converting enzyme 2-like [Chelonus insularis]|uniref:endothelin-converting enzyme 2-like n=1 Tax=Chelonus insularis TaxID=460826 RepID=UPI00158E3E8D|nr:endothelin-converting enzyme 2-like [Chelonus insularis]